MSKYNETQKRRKDAIKEHDDRCNGCPPRKNPSYEEKNAPEAPDWFIEQQRVPSPETNTYTIVLGVACLLAATGICIITVAEDVATAGLGISDDPASFSAATGVFTYGLNVLFGH